ncbi:hypothetical protein C9374_010068 [Naegleria lovaniensis]|uniref:IFT81 calponin homology domain-containing protein n=1 Tax=Naegleria lovaniensis TaxID=51637 RepID=A0AA88KG60_NAELO|nr:uncharacterized protein C9374_010068 [Naegleria lovaniensis]KAG2375064.1 hypothetical protein C9374_010068 [Naegleria lovaniensis]
MSEGARSALASSRGGASRASTRGVSFREQGHGSEDIEMMVQVLNKHLKMNLTLVSFDELSSSKPSRLLDLLNNLIGYLSSDYKGDLNKEAPEQTFQRVMHFLVVILGFKHLRQENQNELASGVMNGDRKTLYPIIFSICQKIEDMKKRVYLAKYMVEIKVPDEFLMDQEVSNVYQQYKQLIQNFKTTHQQTSTLRESTQDPEEIKQRIFKMEREKEQLKVKNEELTKKIRELTNDSESFIDLTSKLNKEQDERFSLEKSQQDQLHKLRESEDRLAQVQKLLAETERDIGSGDVDSLIENLEDVVTKLREETQSKLPTEIGEKQYKIDILKKVSNMSSMTDALLSVDSDIRRLKEEITTLQDELSQKTENQQNKDDNRLTSMVKVVQKKKQDMEKRLHTNQKELSKVQAKIKKVEDDLKQFDGQKIPTAEEFEQLRQEVMQKANIAKKMKAELGELKKENLVLRRTEEILKSKDEKVEQFLRKLEQEKGIQGFRQVQKEIIDASQTKNEIDKEKGETLEEISKIVQELNEKINAQKERLKQPVKQLKILREEHQTVENEYNDKKAVYDNIKLGQESEVTKLRSDIKELQEEIERQQSLYYLLQSQGTINNAMRKRIDDEKDFLDPKSGKKFSLEYQSYTSFLKGRIEKLEQLSKELREKQKYIKETHDPNMKQIEQFTNLRKLLELKMRLQKEGVTGSVHLRQAFGNNNSEAFAPPGVDRLVIN